MQQSYVNINNVPTSVITWGKWIEDDFGENEPKDIILCIPGNPGVTKFYELFLQTIYEEVGIPVWIVGHAGHEKPHHYESYEIPPTKGNENLYNLQGQIEHKVNFIEKYVPKDAKIYFVGHSLGCYTILQLLKHPSIKQRIVESYLLFPTIERLGVTPYGMIISKFVRYITSFLILASWLFILLPVFVQNIFLKLYYVLSGTPVRMYESIKSFVYPYVVSNVLLLAVDEMDSITTRDDEVLKTNSIKLYYGASDHWAPVAYYKRLKQDIPEIKAEICTRGFNHAFVLDYSKDVGELVAKWIKNCFKQNLDKNTSIKKI